LQRARGERGRKARVRLGNGDDAAGGS
jgi:hypothetical protein